MSNPVELNPTIVGEFQAHFGTIPGTQEAATECRKWEKLCEELLKERQQLRAELAKTQIEREAYRSLYELSDIGHHYTREEVFGQIGKGPTLEQLVAELEQEPE